MTYSCSGSSCNRVPLELCTNRVSRICPVPAGICNRRDGQSYMIQLTIIHCLALSQAQSTMQSIDIDSVSCSAHDLFTSQLTYSNLAIHTVAWHHLLLSFKVMGHVPHYLLVYYSLFVNLTQSFVYTHVYLQNCVQQTTQCSDYIISNFTSLLFVP